MKEVLVDGAVVKSSPEAVVLVTSVDDKGRANIIVLSWSMPASFVPKLVAISVGKTRHSHKLIMDSGEFVLCVPSLEMKDAVVFCGTHSGRKVDKFSETGLTPVGAKKVKPPLIAEAVSNNECRVVGVLDAGDHTIFVGEVVAAYVSDEPKRPLYSFGYTDLGVVGRD